jgi:glycosyltransferase involved in cell wall biosynthesis
METILSVIIPVYNEERTITELLNRVIKSQLSVPNEIIIVDDGSTDGSLIAISNWVNQNSHVQRCTVHRHPKNLGKGTAICTALDMALGEIVIIQDADLECDPNDYNRLIVPIRDGSADVVLGSRYLQYDHSQKFTLNRFFVQATGILTWLLYGRRISDFAGCYKVMKTSIFRHLNLRCAGFDFCPEVVSKILRHQLRIVEVPVTYVPRTIKDGKKIRWYHAFNAIRVLVYWKFAQKLQDVCTHDIVSTRLRRFTDSSVTDQTALGTGSGPLRGE